MNTIYSDIGYTREYGRKVLSYSNMDCKLEGVLLGRTLEVAIYNGYKLFPKMPVKFTTYLSSDYHESKDAFYQTMLRYNIRDISDLIDKLFTELKSLNCFYNTTTSSLNQTTSMPVTLASSDAPYQHLQTKNYKLLLLK